MTGKKVILKAVGYYTKALKHRKEYFFMKC